MWVANTFPVRKYNSRTFHLKVRRSRLFRFFRRFPQINVGGDSARIPFVEHASRESRVALPPKGRLQQKPWYFDIKQYVKNKEYPPGISDKDKRTLRRLATSFFVSGTILYKRNHDKTLLRCVDAKEANFMIEEIHEGSFGTHANGHAMARKILRAGYYWLTMESDCCAHVKKCHKCHMQTMSMFRHIL